VSKSMISEAAGMQHLAIVWYLLAAASAGVFLHAGIKFPWFVFFQKDSGLRPSEPPWNMRLAMIFFVALCVGIGVLPGPLYALLPYPVDYVPYTAGHVVFYLQLLLFSGLAFFLMLGWLKRTLTITLDVDLLYRKLGLRMAQRLGRATDLAWNAIISFVAGNAHAVTRAVRRYHGPDGILARTLQTGAMAFWTTVMLAAYLLLSYL
jgi:multicomponent Na+:H+ antiporter subunit D